LPRNRRKPSGTQDNNNNKPDRNRKTEGNGGFLKMSKTMYVSCIVSQGLFESEFFITIKDSSFYVDRINVQVKKTPHNGDEVQGKVIAYLVEEKSDQALIELPGEPVVGSLRAWVPKADLTYA